MWQVQACRSCTVKTRRALGGGAYFCAHVEAVGKHRCCLCAADAAAAEVQIKSGCFQNIAVWLWLHAFVKCRLAYLATRRQSDEIRDDAGHTRDEHGQHEQHGCWIQVQKQHVQLAVSVSNIMLLVSSFLYKSRC